MSFIEREQSQFSGQPLELYRFSMGGTQWLFTSADHEVAQGEDRYMPVFIKRGGFTRGSDLAKATMDIEVAATNPIALLFRTGWLTGNLIITIYRHHYGDNEFSVLWKGRITGCKWKDSVATLSSDSVATLFKRAGLRRVYQVGCPHVLFGPSCGVNASLYGFASTITSLFENMVTVSGASGFPAGYFIGGMLRNGEDLRMIIGHSGNVVTMVDGMANLVVGGPVTLWPGCNRNMTTCKDRFNNLDNFGGLPFLPAKNPFTGDALV